jgi:FixJ family two-component response regulator
MKQDEHQVLVLDDDPTVRRSLDTLLTANGFRVRLHAQPDELFAAGLPTVPACLLLDNQLADGMTGVQVHSELLRLGWDIPTVFLTGHWNVQSVVSAIRSGADGFLTKPYDPKELLHVVGQALDRARLNRRGRMQVAEACARAASLTSRERDIVRMVASMLGICFLGESRWESRWPDRRAGKKGLNYQPTSEFGLIRPRNGANHNGQSV